MARSLSLEECYKRQVAESTVTMRHFRERNKVQYRFAHWPIWIFVFFLAPGPLIFDLFEHGLDRRMPIWLGVVLLAPELPVCAAAPRAAEHFRAPNYGLRGLPAE
jgi:hypothetical protein